MSCLFSEPMNSVELDSVKKKSLFSNNESMHTARNSIDF